MIRWVLATTILLSSQAYGKELSSRLGVGYRNTFPFDLPSLSAVYYPNSDNGFLGALGIDTQDTASRFGVQIGYRRIIFKEEHMNFFMGVQLAMASQEINDETSSGTILDGVIGSEFFIPGLDSLGWNIETGLSVSNIKKIRFRTLADHFLRAGIIFYF